MSLAWAVGSNQVARTKSNDYDTLMLDQHTRAHPNGDFEYTVDVLRKASSFGPGSGFLRIYQPSPTVAFSGRDTLSPGFHRAAEAARSRGFSPLRRPAGGRAVAYTSQSLVVDHIGVANDPRWGSPERFQANAETLVHALKSLGIDAGIGRLDGEYCPGEYSIHARNAVKLVGAAQRIVKNAWLVSAVVQIGDQELVADTTSAVYQELGLTWDVKTAGTVETEAPKTTIAEVKSAIIRSYERQYIVQPA